MNDIENEIFWEFIFLYNIKLSLFEELKNCIEERFLEVLEGLHEFFKFYICSYNILKYIYLKH